MAGTNRVRTGGGGGGVSCHSHTHKTCGQWSGINRLYDTVANSLRMVSVACKVSDQQYDW